MPPRRWVLHPSRQLKKYAHMTCTPSQYGSLPCSRRSETCSSTCFSLLYNSATGPPCSRTLLWSSPSFPAHLPHNNTQMSQGAAEGGGGEGCCHGLRSSGWAGVCAQRLGKEGHKHRFRRTSSCGSCVEVQRMLGKWSVLIGCRWRMGVSWQQPSSFAWS